MQEIIKIFEEIRDTPYFISTDTSKSGNSCSEKHIKLKNIFEKMGIISRYRVCSYKWDRIILPNRVTQIPHQNNSTHVYLEVLVNNKWIDVDATWDKSLQDIFQISHWDGENSTPIAVPVEELFSLEKSKEIMTSTDTSEVQKDLEKNREFYEAFNEWLEENRK